MKVFSDRQISGIVSHLCSWTRALSGTKPASDTVSLVNSSVPSLLVTDFLTVEREKKLVIQDTVFKHKVKVKFSPVQALKALRVVRG
jgi:hypothetical protein